MRRTYRFEGSSVSEAIAKAEETLKVSRENMNIEVVKKDRRGFLGLGRTRAVIKVTLIDPRSGSVREDKGDGQLNRLILEAAEEVTEDHDGLVGVKDGCIIVIPPTGNGRFPVVVPCPGMRLKVNGINCTKRTVVTDRDSIECEVVATEEQKLFEVEVSKDGFCAYLTVYPPVKIVKRLRDSEPVTELELAVDEFVEPLPPLSVTEALEALREKGVVYGLDEEKVEQAVLRHSGIRVAVAFGKPAVPGKNGYLDLVFKRRVKAASERNKKIKIDFRELAAFELVEVGEVIARIIDPVQGQPGMTVTGKEIPCGVAKPVQFNVGQGVRQVDDRLIATISGRPKVTGSLVEVLPQLVIEGDVDLSTGNIKFSGDVFIQGGVAPGMTVRAEGMVMISGIVEKACVIAGDGVISLNSVLNSRVRAGGESAELGKVLPLAKQILHDLEILSDAVEQVNLRLQWRGEEPVQAGRIVEVLIERKLRELPRMAKEVLEICEQKGLHLEAGEVKLFQSIGDFVLHPLSSLVSGEADQVRQLVVDLKEWISNVEDRMKRKSEVYLRYAVNSEVYATGSITVDGQGCFNTLLSSGDRVTVKGEPGVFRGGQIIAANEVYIKELGSEAGALTKVDVREDRRVVCERILGSTLIGIGRRSVRIDEPRRSLVVWMDKDRRIRMR